MPSSHALRVRRTARYYTLGEPSAAVRDVWFVCHGYGQPASELISQFEPIVDPSRLIVAPEALSRFYVTTASGFHGPDAPVGASWMTREDRDNEIADYVAYLDELYAKIFETINRGSVRVTVLGFSQGGATANRWLTRGKSKADRLIMWGSLLPSDADLNEAAQFFRDVELTIVYGTRDQFGKREMIDNYEKLLRQHGIPYRLRTFVGGHRMDRDTLAVLASDAEKGGKKL
jgi:predicted esterase